MITLSSDFGSPYPAAMKGVVLRRSDARLVDVAHDLPRQDVRAAAFWLREVLPQFPPAVHLAVVDPGVGTGRAALVVRAGAHVLVGPDNGSLLPPARRIADATAASVADVEVFDLPVEDPDSSTFHGRDVFAPAAARVHEAVADGAGGERWSGTDVVSEALVALPELDPLGDGEFVDLRLPAATVEDDAAVGEVLAVDDFGNVVTNVPGSFLDGYDAAVVDDEAVPVGETFAAVAPGDRLLTVGSHGYVECDVNRGRGDEAFGLGAGDRVRIERRG